ncbi:TPA: hypothetical protein VDB83_005827 [Burkholderia cenocepacia]|nr:hypothetical protein [Burkholderia cenocepacia]
MSTQSQSVQLSHEDVAIALSSLGEDPTVSRVNAVRAAIDLTESPEEARDEAIRAAVVAARAKVAASETRNSLIARAFERAEESLRLAQEQHTGSYWNAAVLRERGSFIGWLRGEVSRATGDVDLSDFLSEGHPGDPPDEGRETYDQETEGIYSCSRLLDELTAAGVRLVDLNGELFGGVEVLERHVVTRLIDLGWKRDGDSHRATDLNGHVVKATGDANHPAIGLFRVDHERRAERLFPLAMKVEEIADAVLRYIELKQVAADAARRSEAVLSAVVAHMQAYRACSELAQQSPLIDGWCDSSLSGHTDSARRSRLREWLAQAYAGELGAFSQGPVAELVEKVRSELDAGHPKNWRVKLRHTVSRGPECMFECFALDECEAEALARRAEPNCELLSVSRIDWRTIRDEMVPYRDHLLIGLTANGTVLQWSREDGVAFDTGETLASYGYSVHMLSEAELPNFGVSRAEWRAAVDSAYKRGVFSDDNGIVFEEPEQADKVFFEEPE